MFVGHGLLAFAIVALLGRRADWPRDHALALGALAFAFATLPDIDIVYAVVGLAGNLGGPFDAASAFWATSTVVHRTVTHSLVVGTLSAVAFACWHAALDGPLGRRVAAGGASLGSLVTLLATAFVTSGLLATVLLFVFAMVGLVVTTLAGRRLPWLDARAVAGTALVGLLTHPFGDLFTGEPPAMVYPFDLTLVAERVTLHPDPTLHLLAAFGVELLTIWLAAYAVLALTDRRLRPHVSPRAALGVGYAGAALALPAPTLDVSYHFVFTILAVGTVGPVELRRSLLGVRPADGEEMSATHSDATFPASIGIADATTAVTTGLAAVTLAAVGYTGTYLFL